jgi:hypothetical protein
MSISQFGNIAGAYVEVDGQRFDGATFLDPTEVGYAGPEEFRAISGRPYYQGPATWTLAFDASNSDTFQTLYTIWNLKLNTTDGPRVTFGLHDPRTAMGFATYDCWMSEPQFSMSALFIRKVEVKFTTVIQS